MTDQGPQGADGEQGMQGTQGERGGEGAQGERGTQGGEGDQGKRGTQGEPGPHGRQGEPGVSGGQGTAGQRGERGASGQAGDTTAVVEVAHQLTANLDENTAALDRVLRRQRLLTIGGAVVTVLLVVVALYAGQSRREAVRADEAAVDAKRAVMTITRESRTRDRLICESSNQTREVIRDFVLGILGEPNPEGDPQDEQERQEVRDRVRRDFADVKCPPEPS